MPLIERLLPRHMQIIYAINAECCSRRAPTACDDEQVERISLIDEGGERRVRMGNLAFVGSHNVNGVSALHTELMKKTVFADLHQLYPDRINNKTNGITPRRWLIQCNPGLTDAGARGDRRRLPRRHRTRCPTSTPSPAMPRFRETFAAVKRANKARLAKLVAERLGIRVDPSALFDVQIKRIHEYKRQLLNIIETVALYDQIRSHPERDWAPRVKILRRQGGAELSQRQADHQARQRRGQGDQPRPLGARPAEGRVPAELQCQPGRDHHAGGRPVGADLDRRHGSLRHRQHEVRAERRAHHRHARRRQRRDPRNASATTTSSSSA